MLFRSRCNKSQVEGLNLGQPVPVALFAAEGDISQAEEVFQTGLVFSRRQGNKARTFVARGRGVG